MAMNLEQAWIRLWHGNKLVDWAADACAASVWIGCALCLRALLDTLCLLPYVPEGLIFGIPFYFQEVARLVHFDFLYFNHFPNLSVRLAECLMGRFPKKKLFGIVSAQLVGTLFGTIFFYTWYSMLRGEDRGRELLLPIRSSVYGDNYIYSEYAWPHHFAGKEACINQDVSGTSGDGMSSGSSSTSVGDSCASSDSSRVTSTQYYSMNETPPLFSFLLYNTVLDILLTCACTLVVLILPEILRLNGLHWRHVYLPVFVLIVVHCFLISQTSLSAALNPAAAAVLWYLHIGAGTPPNAGLASVLQDLGESLGASAKLTLHPLLADISAFLPVRAVLHIFSTVYNYIFNSTVFAEHWCGAIIGGLLAGLICRRLAPDDKNSWKRKA